MKFADFRVGKTLRSVSVADLPIGFNHYSKPFVASLREFRQKILPTDIIYHFAADQSEWDKGFGSEGYVLVRDGELFDTLLLKMN